jgi:SAM-dependent methyltransferase
MNKTLWNHKSMWGFDWIRGKYFLPRLKKWGERINGTIIDIGCGSEPYRAFLEKRAEYIGIDKDKTEAKADALHLPFRNASVDACFNSWLLDDISEPNEYFKELRRILKPGGISIMIENQSFPEHDAPDDYFRFTKYGLKYLAGKNGFETAEMTPLGGFWANIGIQITSFFIKGVSGHIGGWVKIFNPPINLLFYGLDKIIFLERGTSGYFAVFRKTDEKK